MAHISHISKSFNIHIYRGRDANTFATYNIALINDVAKVTVHILNDGINGDAHDDANNDDDNATPQLHMLSYPLGQISQKERIDAMLNGAFISPSSNCSMYLKLA